MRAIICAAFLLAEIIGRNCQAETPKSLGDDSKSPDATPKSAPGNNPAVPVSNDLTNYQGDRVTFNTDVVVRVQRADGTAGRLFCVPAHVRLRGGVGYSASSTDGKTETGTLFRLLKTPNKKVELAKARSAVANFSDLDPFNGAKWAAECNHFDVLPGSFGATEQRSAESEPVSGTSLPPESKATNSGNAVSGADEQVNLDWYDLSQGVDLRVTKETLDRAPPNRYGLTYGLLAVPFKYQLSHNKEFSGSATVGPYLGYRTVNAGHGYGISGIVFLGYSNISVTRDINGESKTQNLASIGYGLGVIATVKGSFQLGAVLGFDHVNNDSNYQYNNKPWIAVELGYSFLQ